MREVKAINVQMNHTVGYGEVYYFGGPKQNFCIQVDDKKVFDDALSKLRFRHIMFGNPSSGNFRHTPFIGPYLTSGFLYGDSFVAANELKNPTNPLRQRSFPEIVLDIVSPSKESLKRAAESLGLPSPLELEIQDLRA